jgi:excisionase family DNA binding protein
MAISSPYLTPREALDYLRIGSLSELYRLIREHRMPFCRVGGRYRFDIRELDAWTHGHASTLDRLRAERRKTA